MIARTSAKSRLIRPGTVIRSLMPWTPWRSTSSTTRNASTIEVSFWTTSLSRSLGIVMRVSTLSLSASLAFSALSRRRAPSKLNGLVTTPMVSAPRSRAISAMTGARPEPVPPPMPAVMNTMSESLSASEIFSASSSAARWPMPGSPPAPRPRVDLVADADLVRRVGLEQRLRIGVHGDELDAHHLRPDHAVDGVAAAAADADHPDEREVLRVGSQRHARLPSRSSRDDVVSMSRAAAGRDGRLIGVAEYRHLRRRFSRERDRVHETVASGTTLRVDSGQACRRARLSPRGMSAARAARVVRVGVEQRDRLPRARAAGGRRRPARSPTAARTAAARGPRRGRATRAGAGSDRRAAAAGRAPPCRSSSDRRPAPRSRRPAVAWGTKTVSRPSPSPATNRAQRRSGRSEPRP